MDEIEIKYRLAGPQDHTRLRAELLRLGARPSPVRHEDNRLYDDAQRSLSGRGAVLRLRILDGGAAATMTFKGRTRMDGVIKSREELEFGVNGAEAAEQLLRALGYLMTLSYAKEREAWQLDAVEVALDTLAFGHFCEIEGPADQIRRIAPLLGLSDAQAEPAGYPTLSTRHLNAARGAQAAPPEG